MSDLELPSPVPHKTLGVLLIGLTISSSIYGVTFAQAVQYYRRYSSDSKVLKVSVAVVWALETLNQGLTMFSVYHYLVRNRGNLGALSYTEWSLAVPSGTNALAASIIQLFVIFSFYLYSIAQAHLDSFFAYRVYIMSDRNLCLTGSVCAMSVAQCAVAFAVMVQSLRFPAATDYHRFEHLVPPAFAITAATDVFITASLCYYLQIRKARLEKAGGVVNRLTLLAINNGILSRQIFHINRFRVSASCIGYDASFCDVFPSRKSVHEYSPVQLELKIKHKGASVSTDTPGNTVERST
ncbi:uncharacterized protein BT62DRAFT_1001859 [Guyanagaster necrorhizus]|uniref:DUF6534 domain-containing protein n=1 Tax=Guyanagaster necrorhizus TaxID=856835 RepID=A0A9P8AVH4_9AGAR|nr:uncharacterized protein BT62DRAFT_1001859 [Guyanagaster necrorhizus MCA 3950]KAG7449569.1 hypothetical protein BT62DRAFT_1001859 [Guyanagaster necrorhizus MCA 3950]